jgi:HD superfamily phosphohydrolase
VLDHSLLASDFAARAGMPHAVRLAGLYHDLGKTSTAHTDENGTRTFYRHEKESSSQAKTIACGNIYIYMEVAEEAWKKLLRWVSLCRIPEMIKVGQSVRNYFWGILTAIQLHETIRRREQRITAYNE